MLLNFFKMQCKKFVREADFNESSVEKKAKEPQPPLDGMIGKAYFWTFVDFKDPS